MTLLKDILTETKWNIKNIENKVNTLHTIEGKELKIRNKNVLNYFINFYTNVSDIDKWGKAGLKTKLKTAKSKEDVVGYISEPLEEYSVKHDVSFNYFLNLYHDVVIDEIALSLIEKVGLEFSGDSQEETDKNIKEQ